LWIRHRASRPPAQRAFRCEMSAVSAGMRTVLFLQGPLSALYARIGDHLTLRTWRVYRINLCFGDWLHWRGPAPRAFRGPFCDWGDYVDRFIDDHGVTDLVLHGDRRIYQRVAAERARARGVRVFVTELGYLRPDWMTIERNATGAGSAFSRDPDDIRRVSSGGLGGALSGIVSGESPCQTWSTTLQTCCSERCFHTTSGTPWIIRCSITPGQGGDCCGLAGATGLRRG
jgi:hypothetical protein